MGVAGSSLAATVKDALKKDGLRLIDLLVNVSQFEFFMKRTLPRLLSSKPTYWNEYKKEGVERMADLAEFFSGEKPLTRVQKSENLQSWFNNMAQQIGHLQFEQSTGSGRTIVQLIQALEQVQQFHQVRRFLHTKIYCIDVVVGNQCSYRPISGRDTDISSQHAEAIEYRRGIEYLLERCLRCCLLLALDGSVCT
jgi:WASH complex subunit strumpellin